MGNPFEMCIFALTSRKYISVSLKLRPSPNPDHSLKLGLIPNPGRHRPCAVGLFLERCKHLPYHFGANPRILNYERAGQKVPIGDIKWNLAVWKYRLCTIVPRQCDPIVLRMARTHTRAARNRPAHRITRPLRKDGPAL